MNQEALEALFQLFPEGMFDEPADLNDIIEKEGLEGVYPLLPEGMFETEEEFVETFGGQKKKDIGVQQPRQACFELIEKVIPKNQLLLRPFG